MGFWVGVIATILALGIAVTLSIGLLALSYARATAPEAAATTVSVPLDAAPTPAPTVPQPGVPTEPSVTDRLRDNPSGALSRGAAFLVMLLLIFFVGQWGLRSTEHPGALGVAIGCGWGFAILAALLGLGAALRFTLTLNTSILEYVSYGVLIGLNLTLAVVLSIVGRLGSVCRSFAILMAIVATAQLLLTLFGSGLRFDLHFLANFVYLLMLMVSVAALLYITGLLEQLYPPVNPA